MLCMLETSHRFGSLVRPIKPELPCRNHDASDSLSWSEKSMEVLEGGEEAFFERLRVYEAGAR